MGAPCLSSPFSQAVKTLARPGVGTRARERSRVPEPGATWGGAVLRGAGRDALGRVQSGFEGLEKSCLGVFVHLKQGAKAQDPLPNSTSALVGN